MPDNAATQPQQMPFDYKDILNIHGYFTQNEIKSDTARNITARCEEMLLATLTETRSIASGNWHCSHD